MKSYHENITPCRYDMAKTPNHETFLNNINGQIEKGRGIKIGGRARRSLNVGGLWGSAYAYLISQIYGKHSRPLLIATRTVEEAESTFDDLKTFIPAHDALYLFPAGGEFAPQETLHQRLIILKELASPGAGAPIIVSPIQGLAQGLPPPATLSKTFYTIKVNQNIQREELIQRLSDNGFALVPQIESAGEFSVRGGIMDIYPYEFDAPLRIEWNGNNIESIRRFDVESQLSEDEEIKEVSFSIIPSTALSSGDSKSNTILNYLPKNTLYVVKDLNTDELKNTPLPEPVMYLNQLPVSDIKTETVYNFNIQSLQRFSIGLANMLDELTDLARRVSSVIIFCQNEPELKRLKEILPKGLRPEIRLGRMAQGFYFKEIDTAFISYNELFNRVRLARMSVAGIEPRPTGMAARPLETFLELKPGDFVVHQLYGIARYRGIELLVPAGSDKSIKEEFLVLEYQDSALVYVPVSQIDLVQKYVGGADRRPEMERLGTGYWEARKQRAINAIQKLAIELLQVQAIRHHEKGIAYPPDTDWQTEFEASFPYEDTPDQVTLTGLIKKDMESARPMDRLICGDVGYGKTELAIRAAFKAALHNKQVAILAPTTILAQQHCQNFSERMTTYPIVVEVLSRFKSAKEQAQTVNLLAEGKIDIIIDTHRLLQPDIKFQDLGLVVIDEEQRFGVEHKEHLKKLKATMDVLTLTATPIPRTLHMSLVGLREISTLTTSPQNRRAIETVVARFDRDIIRKAIQRELDRNGQVYFVHNRIYDIERISETLQEILPKARIIIAHGQLSGTALEERMEDFINGKADILVCTNIIESGLDIPRVNTIFINNAQWFGLADLHQLRGRVGRYKHQAFAYFLIPPEESIDDEAAKRLKAIQEFNELGAGFKIALRDIEIRGIGNILGKEQHGHIAAIGYDLYVRLLEQTVKLIKAGKAAASPALMRGKPVATGLPALVETEVSVELGIDAYIPHEYAPSEKQRIELYRKISALKTVNQSSQLNREITDRFGKPIPQQLHNLVRIALLKSLARQWSLTSIILAGNKNIIAHFTDISKVEELKTRSHGMIRIIDDKTCHILISSMSRNKGIVETLITELLRNAPFVILNGVPTPPCRDEVKNLRFMRIWDEILRPDTPCRDSE
ncbi:MAG: transcription-repair coupling factor [Planctomycetes bacterium]|nr:transcription-repair coupling factor [Planctomycetota bacterium]